MGLINKTMNNVSERKRRIYNLNSKLPRKGTIKKTIFSILFIAYAYLNYKAISSLPVSFFDYMSMSISEANSIGISTMFYNCYILLYVCNTLVIVALVVLFIINGKPLIEKCELYLKKAWNIFPD